MQCHIFPEDSYQYQQLSHEWFGSAVPTPVEFAFSTDGEYLIFRAKQAEAAHPHPEAGCGEFREELWRYDTAEFFIAAAAGAPYMEINLSPKGAWWACAFSAPRVAAQPPVVPAGVVTDGHCDENGWACRIRIPLKELEKMGIDPKNCRLAATAILNTPNDVYLTTADDVSGNPDFHRPHAWASPNWV